MFAVLVLVCLSISAGLSAPVLRRDGEGPAQLVLFLDTANLRKCACPTDDYGMKPLGPPLPPDVEDPYQPNLENEYY